jgi:transcriptional regulator with XRE-family HTH domain
MPPPGGQRSAHLRALIAYGQLDRRAVADILDVSVRTVSRLASGEATPNRDQLELVAAAVQWSVGIDVSGAAAVIVSAPSTEARLEDLERRVAQLEHTFRPPS